MHPRTHLLATLGLLLGCAAGTVVSHTNVDRIILAIGVDAIHSENEEPRMRRAVAEAVAELNRSGASPVAMPHDGPQFEAMVKQAIEANRRLRRDPLVTEAYRATLKRMLTPQELAAAAAFYASPAGRRAHIAVVEAEKAAGLVMDRISAGQN